MIPAGRLEGGTHARCWALVRLLVRPVTWVKPEYSRADVNRAGKVLIESGGAMRRTEARRVVANWRSAHGYPLHALTNTLANRCDSILDGRGIVTRRLKRLVSIENKLLRRPHTRATQIQDLGGCRVILPTIADVRTLQAIYEARKKGVFTLHRTDDYITHPKSSGYRSLHLVYRYESEKKPDWQNMRVELQMRSALQHMWATAVEAASFFLGQDLKAGESEGEGNPQWLRFFVLMGHWIAFEEWSPSVPNVDIHTPEEFPEELAALANDLDVDNRLAYWAASFKFIGQHAQGMKSAHRFLVHMDVNEQTVQLQGFSKREGARASDIYSGLEIQYADDPNHHVILVTARSYNVLKQGYPGFFADTTGFREVVARAMKMAEKLRIKDPVVE